MVGKFVAPCVFDSDIDTLANSLKEGLLSTAKGVLRRQKKRIQPWVTNEVLDLYDQRWQLKQQMYTSTEPALEYRKVNREVRKKMKTTKEERTEEQCKNMEKGMMSGNSMEAYGALRALTRTQQHKSAVVEDSSGNILTESKAVLNRWTEYCNYGLHPDTRLLQSKQTPTQEAESLPVLREEVEKAVRSLKAGKSPRVDKIPSELLKNGGEATTTVLTAIYQKI